MALPVIDKLASHSAMHAIRGVFQVENPYSIAEGVGKYPLGGTVPTQIYNIASIGGHGPDCLDLKGVGSWVIDDYMDIS
ncbi:MAG: hypothetical protein ACLQMO_11360 [Acidobacteriaceae bacterium]